MFSSVPLSSCKSTTLADACASVSTSSTFLTHEVPAYKLTLRGDRILLEATTEAVADTVPVPAAAVTVDASGSMTYGSTARVSQARLCLETVEHTTTGHPETNDGNPHLTAITKFGPTWAKVTHAAGFLIDNDVGTALLAAANGLEASYADVALALARIRSENRGGEVFVAPSPPPVNVVLVTDCESVNDQFAARKKFDTLPLNGAVVFIGVGDKHTISSLMAVAPPRCKDQAFYIRVPERMQGRGSLDVPTDAIRDALLSVQIAFSTRDAHGNVTRSVDVRVLKGADYLFPAGVQANDIFLYGKPVGSVVTAIDAVSDDAVVSVRQLKRYSDAATLNIVRAYNFALAELELQPYGRPGSDGYGAVFLRPVVDLANQELAFITSLRDCVREEGVSSEDIDIARAAIHASVGACCSPANPASMSHVRRTLRRMRDPAGETLADALAAADSIVDILRELRNRIRAPPSAASLQLANNLLDALGSGKMGSGRVAALLGKIAKKQDVGLYAGIANDLQVYEDAKEEATTSVVGATAAATLALAYASPEADELDRMIETPAVCTATFDSIGCLVAVGSLKRVIAGAMDPLLTHVIAASREPYKIQAVRLAGDDGFRASAGFANGIIGVFPGDSVGAAIAFKLIASNMATGEWSTTIHGLRPLLALLAGVVYLLKQPPTASIMEFANTLTHGFLGVAARTRCRVMACDGTADATTPVVSGLSACRTLLTRAFEEPYGYLGANIMPADYWTTLEFAMRYAAARLGENYAVRDRPAAFTAVLIVSSIVRFANFFVTPQASTSDREAFDSQKRDIGQFVKFLPLYIGLPNAATALPPIGVHDIRRLPLSYEERDVKTVSCYEQACIRSSLDVARRVDPITHESDELQREKSVRATFWEAVRKAGTPEPLQNFLNVYEHPDQWETTIEVEAAACRATHYAQREAHLRTVCKTAFLNAATSLPIAVYNPAIKRLRVSADAEGLKDVAVELSLGNDSGLLPGRYTGLLKNVCLAMDSTHFLRGSFTKYLEESYTAGPGRDKTFFPCFHANMTAWSEDPELMERARSAWPAACPLHLAGSVSHWLWQRAAFKAVAEAALPIDIDEVMLKCTSSLNIVLVEPRAANWDVSDAVEADACLAAYGPHTQQWSYYRAVVEFYAALRADTDVFTGVFKATRFLTELGIHRGFVVSRSMYRASLTLHGVSDADLDSAVCNDVYKTMAAKRLH